MDDLGDMSGRPPFHPLYMLVKSGGGQRRPPLFRGPSGVEVWAVPRFTWGWSSAIRYAYSLGHGRRSWVHGHDWMDCSGLCAGWVHGNRSAIQFYSQPHVGRGTRRLGCEMEGRFARSTGRGGSDPRTRQTVTVFFDTPRRRAKAAWVTSTM